LVKSELVQRLVARNPHLYQRDVENIVDAILREIADALARYDRVELRGFGVFSTKQRRARTGRNPRTGDNVLVIEKHVPLGRARNCANCSIDVEIRPAQRDGRTGRPHFGDVRGVFTRAGPTGDIRARDQNGWDLPLAEWQVSGRRKRKRLPVGTAQPACLDPGRIFVA
jgi:integration host factor subunit beta